MVDVILSKHYDARNPATSKPIKPEEHKSMERQFEPSFAGYTYGQPSLTIKNGEAYLTSANRREAFTLNDIAQYGFPAGGWEERGPRFEGWLSAGRNNYPNLDPNREISSVPMPRIAYIEGITPLRMNFPNKYDTPVADYTTRTIAHIGPINDTGKEVYKTHLRKQDVRNFLFDEKGIREETAAWLPFLTSVGFPIKRENPVYAIGVEHDVENIGYVAAYYPNTAKRYVVFEHRFDAMVRRLASELGIKDRKGIEALKRSVISHEILRHGAAEIGGERADEELQGWIDFNFYSEQAGSHKGTDMEDNYLRLREEGRRFAKGFSISQHIKDEITKSPVSYPSAKVLLAETFLKHGIALGKKGRELAKYIEDRLEETYGSLLDQPSYREGELERVIKSEENGGNNDGRTKKVYERAIGKSKYKNMDDVKERNPKEAKNTKQAEKEGKEAPEEASESKASTE